ncbi:APO protein 3, mitochondrial-like [Apium graveolens]|uniref:APO protein 3, mitochondrial-like n=1 Tax=Apium graveolens TaxID=4045 RepID=UPI003D799233
MFLRRNRSLWCMPQVLICGKQEAYINNLRALFSARSNSNELPRKFKRSERKPMVTSVNELKRKARREKHERLLVREVTLSAPENGLLVKSLVPVARDVLAARDRLLDCAAKVVMHTSIYFCRLCGEVHVGDPPHKIKTCNVVGSQMNKEHVWEKGGLKNVLPVVKSYHLYDRIGRAVSHNERLQVDRIPAILELCVQAGVDILEYPTRRRKFPVYYVAGRIIEFEKRFPNDLASVKDINEYGFWENRKKLICDEKYKASTNDDLQGIAVRGMEAWEKMQLGATKLMQKYAVQTCGYCSEVQVGPKGHRVRQCQAFKHQMRDGQHAWQEATLDDLIPIVYVWHVKNPHNNELLVDSLKRYYGKLPAVVEMFAQAGACVGDNYCSLMREDVTVPEVAEEKLVV